MSAAFLYCLVGFEIGLGGLVMVFEAALSFQRPEASGYPVSPPLHSSAPPLSAPRRLSRASASKEAVRQLLQVASTDTCVGVEPTPATHSTVTEEGRVREFWCQYNISDTFFPSLLLHSSQGSGLDVQRILNT